MDILTHRPQDWILPDSIRLKIILISARLGLHSESLLVTVRIGEDLWLRHTDPQLISSFRIKSSTSIIVETLTDHCLSFSAGISRQLCSTVLPSCPLAPPCPTSSPLSSALTPALDRPLLWGSDPPTTLCSPRLHPTAPSRAWRTTRMGTS